MPQFMHNIRDGEITPGMGAKVEDTNMLEGLAKDENATGQNPQKEFMVKTAPKGKLGAQGKEG